MAHKSKKAKKAKKKSESTARKTSDLPTRNRTLGVVGKRPFNVDQHRMITQQVRYAHEYKTALIEVEQSRLAAKRAYERTLDDEIVKIDDQLEVLDEQITELYDSLDGVARRSTPQHPDADEKRAKVKAAVEALKEERKPLYEARKARLGVVRATYFKESFDVYKEVVAAEKKRITEANGGKLPGPYSRARRAISGRVAELMQARTDVTPEWRAYFAIQEEHRLKRCEVVEKMHTGELFAESAAAEAKRAAKLGYTNPDGYLYSGGYSAVDSEVEATFKTTYNPEVPHFDGTGRVGIQFAKKKGGKVVTWGDALRGTSQIKITTRLQRDTARNPQPDESILTHRRPSLTGGQRREPLMISLKIAGRVKDARWIDVPVLLHRDIPLDAVIKWAYLIVKREGGGLKYDLMFTLEHESFTATPKGEGTVAAILGWKVMADEDQAVRVCTLYDGNGFEEVLLGRVAAEKDRAEAKNSHTYRQWDNFINKGLLAIADQCFYATVTRFSWWRKTHKLGVLRNYRGEVIDLKQARKWKAHKKLSWVAQAMLARYCTDLDVESFWAAWKADCGVVKPKGGKWSQKRRASRDLFNWKQGLNEEGDFDPKALDDHMKLMLDWFQEHGVEDERAQMALYLEWWRRKDSHLVTWARREQVRMKRSIREVFRVKAADLATRYGRVVLLDWDKSKTAESPALEDDTRTQQEVKAAAVRQAVGPSGFANALQEAFGERRYQKVGAEAVPLTCQCGRKPRAAQEDTDLGATRQCSCGKVIVDKDKNRAVTLWNIFRDDPTGSTDPTDPPQVDEDEAAAAE